MNILAKTAIIITASIAMLSSAQAGPMQNATGHAEKALEALQDRATTDKGDHRVAAMKHPKAAIAEIDKGVAFDQATVTPGERKKKNR